MKLVGGEKECVSLSSLPSLIIRKIIKVVDDDLKGLRVISRSWNKEASERLHSLERVRRSLPSIRMSFEETQSGEVHFEAYMSRNNIAYFTANNYADGTDKTPPLYRTGAAEANRGWVTIVALLSILYLPTLPLLPPSHLLAIPFLVVYIHSLIDEDEKVYGNITSMINITGGISILNLTNLSEKSMRRVRELVRTVGVGKIFMNVIDFDNENRKALLNMTLFHRVTFVEISAEKCALDGLREYLHELASLVSVLRISESGVNADEETEAMFGRDWDFWANLAQELADKGAQCHLDKGTMFLFYEWTGE